MADITKLAIYNMSLSHIGQKPIASLGDGSVQDDELNKVYEPVLKETLSSFNWGFAKVQAALVVTADYDPANYTYAYIRPTACLEIRKVNEQTELDKNTSGLYEEMYDIAKDLVRIVTDIEDAYIEYTYYVENVARFTHYFVNTLSHRLAAEIAVPLNGDKDMAKDQGAIFNRMVGEAHRHDSSQRMEKHEGNEKSAFVDARE